MCRLIFSMHECDYCGRLKEVPSHNDPEFHGFCPECASPNEVKLEFRLWICPSCEEERVTDEPKYPPNGQCPQRAFSYMFPNEPRRQKRAQPQNERRFQDAPRFQDEPRFQDTPRFQPFQNNSSGHRAAQQNPDQQGEQRPKYFQMGHPPRGQYEPRRQGRRESHDHHHHHHHY
ncbi:uncharacterized protein FMAN_14928 [Fusarium mangiferae]|uniref:Uncharacterized protein n=1 Tax=Fusarium mangiferae TaxID=192010 RepID=A0A1L7U7J5_FUSMA|nr:uncharacterized protein FMAN_14928 [Fusarium mangiferae]CVL03925.1 uncharacterized protein FMAN_14928 [Fusarium mangiferae]